ncbi:MAG: ATP-binding protein [Pirellulaceae bacterium]
MTTSPATDDMTFGQQLREINDALLVSSVRQHEMVDQAQRAEAALATTNGLLAGELSATRRLQEMSSRMVRAGDVADLYQHIVEAAADIMGSDMASMQIFDPERNALRLLAHHGLDPASSKTFEWVASDSNTSCGMALRSGSRVVVPDIETFPGIAGTPTGEAQLAAGVRASQSTPLLSRDGIMLGMITTHWRSPHLPPKRELRRLDILVRQAADLIERALSEATMRSSEVRYRRLFESAQDGILILDAQTGRITDANAFLCGLLEVEAHQLLGKELHEIGVLENKSASQATVRELQEKGYVRYENLPLQAKQGKRIEVEVIANVYREGEGGRNVIQFSIRDISERGRLERQLKVQTEALVDLHRRKDEFLAMLSHELRNPLAPISNSVQLLRLQPHEEVLQQQARTIIERQLAQLTRLVDDLLEVSRISTGRIHLHQERVALNGIVENAIETVGPLIGQHGHSLEATLSPEPIWLYADASRLEQVVVNLLTNAAKYTVDGGKIWLSVRQEGDEAVLRVKDTGVGIAPELLPHVFDLFTQAERSLDRAQGGLGIGLSLVQRLVELHRGRVEAHSTLGQGSEFVVHLPVLLSPALPPAVVVTAAAKSPGPALRVLVVDDNIDAAQTLGMLLRATGHDVRMVYNGPAALEAAVDFHPEVVLLDIGLPGLDGFEVARRLRVQPDTQSALLIAMTGYGQEADRQRSLAAGFNHHLVKPVSFEKVREILASVAAKMA